MKFYLQLFASTSAKQEQSGSSSHTEGGSTSSTSGWSSTDTTGRSETTTSTQGGAHSESSGKQWASGQVEEKTQSMRDKYNNDYSQGQKVEDAYNRLQETLDKKPQFESQYESKLNELYDQIMNRDKFTYDFNADQMYQAYKDQYTTQGKKAMEDTMAQNAALSGGYGSSYAQTVGQQTYQNYLQKLNDMLPTLRNQAYQEYTDEGNRLNNLYGIASDAYNREYGQYRDSVSDWQNDRAFNQSNYQDERNFDYNQFANDRNYWNQEYWNEKNSEQSNASSSDQTNWSNSHSITNSKSHSDTNYGSTTNTSSWSDTTNNAWSNSLSSSGGGSGSGRSTTTPSYSSVPAASGWYDSVDQRIQQSLAQPGAIESNTRNKTDADTKNLVQEKAAPFDLQKNGTVAQQSDRDLKEMAAYISTMDAQQQEEFKKQMKLTTSEMEWLKYLSRVS